METFTGIIEIGFPSTTDVAYMAVVEGEEVTSSPHFQNAVDGYIEAGGCAEGDRPLEPHAYMSEEDYAHWRGENLEEGWDPYPFPLWHST